MLAQDDIGQLSTSGSELDLPPFDPEVAFTDRKDRHRPRAERRQRKMLRKVSGYIGSFLERDERIWLVTTACSPFGLLEQLTTGWAIVYVKRAILVFTDRRILHVPARVDYGYRGSIARIAYSDCESLRMRGHRLIVRYKDGKKESFNYVARSERGKIKALIQRIPIDAQPAENPARVHLCPRCTKPLQTDSYECPNCHLTFKDAAEAKRASILYPGGGYFYTGHPWLGSADAVTEGLLLLLTAASLWEWANGREAAGAGALVFGLILALEKIVTIYHTQHFVREFIPKEKRPPTVALQAAR
jgi:hypothetical protein